MVQVAVLLPSTEVAVMVAVPAAMAVTKPEELTLATFVSLDVHVTFLSVASAGETVAVSWKVPPAVSDSALELSETPVTETVAVWTVMVQVAVLLPSTEVAVIVAVPAAMAVTKPDELTLATDVLLLVHVTFLLVAFVGATVAVSWNVPPSVSDPALELSETPVTETVAA